MALNQAKCRFDTGFTFTVGSSGVGDVELGFNKTGVPWDKCILGNQGGVNTQFNYDCLAFEGNMFDQCCNITNYPQCEIVLNSPITSQEVVDASNQLYELCNIDIRDFINLCSNNCPGVRLSDIIAGGLAIFPVTALVTVSSLSSFTPLVPLFGGLGVLAVGAGGAMIVSGMCLGPFFCTTRQGACCPVVMAVDGLTCPDFC